MTIKKKYPFPHIDNLFGQIGGARIFSEIDLWLGYHHIRIKEEDIHKTTFLTRYKHYEFRVVCFCLTNSPTTFMWLMNKVFIKYL